MRPLVRAVAVVALVLLSSAPVGVAAQARDSDGDGMPNSWERAHGLDPNDAGDASRDPDRDRLTNIDEYFHHGDPHNRDTDRDGLRDGAEVRTWQSLVDVPNQLIGRIRVSGRCPTSDSKEGCPLRDLFAVTVEVRTRSGELVMQTRTLLNGRFTFQDLRPRTYLLGAVAVAGTAASGPFEALVTKDQPGPTVAAFTFSDSNRRGVVGQATQSPTCPVQREGEDCVAPLDGAAIEVHEGDEHGRVVSTTTTGADGYYAFQLDPGAYTLVARPMGDSAFPVPPAPVSFTVFAADAGPNAIDAPYDTGIR